MQIPDIEVFREAGVWKIRAIEEKLGQGFEKCLGSRVHELDSGIWSPDRVLRMVKDAFPGKVVRITFPKDVVRVARFG